MSLKDYLIMLTLDNDELTPVEKSTLIAKFCAEFSQK